MSSDLRVLVTMSLVPLPDEVAFGQRGDLGVTFRWRLITYAEVRDLRLAEFQAGTSSDAGSISLTRNLFLSKFKILSTASGFEAV